MKLVRDAITFPRDARVGWKRRGAAGVWRELRTRTLDRVAHAGIAIVFEQDISDVPIRPLADGLRITPFAGPDWSAFRELTTDRHIQHFRTRIARGRTCLVAWRGERPVGYIWTSTRIDPDIEKYQIPLPHDATYHWDLFVDQSERGSAVGSAIATRAYRRGEGEFRRVWRLIDADNMTSHRSVQKNSPNLNRVVGELHFFHALGRTWSRFTPGPGRGMERVRAQLERAR